MIEKMKSLPNFKRAPRLSDQINTFLNQEIEKGLLKPGQRLPSENNLAEQFGVSRTVIREAFASLKRDGLLESKHGIGAVVAESGNLRAFRLEGLENANAEEISQLFELRAILEGDAARLAAKRRSDQDADRLKQCLEAMAVAVREGRDGSGPDADFHQTIAEASGNPYLRAFMSFINGKLRLLIRKARDHSSLQPGLPGLVQQEHATIFEAIAEKEPQKARWAALAHLENAARRLGLDVL